MIYVRVFCLGFLLGALQFLALHLGHTLFYCASQMLCFLYKLKSSGNPATSKSIGTIFPTIFVYSVSVSHFDNSHNIS